MGTLYLVATPIGNLEDISARAVRILREVPLIAAEDTRHTARLLNHFEIPTRLTSYHEHNKNKKIPSLLSKLQHGDLALVSDAGTPGLNDPGYELVQAAWNAGHKVSPIPGACAPISAIIASGLPAGRFFYLGYLPRKSGERRRFLQEVAILAPSLVLLETPHRLLAALKDFQEILGNRQIAIARELTKLHEEIYRGSIQEALTHFHEQPPRGEFTLVVAGSAPGNEAWPETRLMATARDLLEQGTAPSKIASSLAAISGWKRKDIYQVITGFKQ